MTKQKRITVARRFNSYRDRLAFCKSLTAAGLDYRILKRSFPFYGSDCEQVTLIISQALAIAYFNKEQLKAIHWEKVSNKNIREICSNLEGSPDASL